MKDMDQVYTFGLWLTKPGKEAEFIAAWESFARWTSEHQPGMAGQALLLQDIDRPKRFVSIGGWTDMQKVQAWRQLPEFRAFFAKAEELCETMEPHSLKPVVRIAQGKS
jgi:quinol monooxygenase YgiN